MGTQVVFTSDSQVTVVIDDGSIGPARGERSVELLVEPIDPAELAAARWRPRRVRQRLRGRRERTGPRATRSAGFDRPIQMILVYPATSTLHATTHEMLFSSDGETWETLETTDSPGQQQAEADVPGPRLRVVAGVPVPGRRARGRATGSASGGTARRSRRVAGRRGRRAA